MRAINPATGEVIREYEEYAPGKVQQLLRRAEVAFGRWREMPFSDRADTLGRVGKVLRLRKMELAALMTQEMGKPITASEGEVEKCAVACDFYAEWGAEFLSVQRVASDADESYVRCEPIGPVLAIMPWNFPMWQVFRFAAPALMAGNVGVLKHASNVPGTSLAIEQVFREAGLPEGCFTTLLLGAGDVEAVIASPVIRAITLTGSDKAGRAVAAAAGREIKKTVLELGGSDPFIVLADADIAKVAVEAANARCINSGQSCIAAKRFIVDRRVAERFEGEFAKAVEALPVGDPMDRGTVVGPLAREDLVSALEDQVKRSVEAGAQIIAGGQRLARKGYYFAPTVLTQVTPGNPAFEEETFGPVAAVVRADSADHAVELANRSSFGLGASIWTRDMYRARRMAERIEAGMVFINGIVKSDPRLPFGGVKNSGYGRELSAAGIREFVNIKTVWVRNAEVEGPVKRAE